MLFVSSGQQFFAFVLFERRVKTALVFVSASNIIDSARLGKSSCFIFEFYHKNISFITFEMTKRTNCILYICLFLFYINLTSVNVLLLTILSVK